MGTHSFVPIGAKSIPRSWTTHTQERTMISQQNNKWHTWNWPMRSTRTWSITSREMIWTAGPNTVSLSPRGHNLSCTTPRQPMKTKTSTTAACGPSTWVRKLVIRLLRHPAENGKGFIVFFLLTRNFVVVDPFLQWHSQFYWKTVYRQRTTSTISKNWLLWISHIYVVNATVWMAGTATLNSAPRT